MSRVAQLNLRNQIRELRERYEAVHLPALERARERLTGAPENSLAGQGRNIIVEAQIRQYLLDPIVESFGWQPGSTEQMIVEDAANPQDAAESRKFLDYHGRETDADNGGRSLLVLEAKRARVALPGAPDIASPQLARQISDVLVRISRGEAGIDEFSADWLERLRILSNYVRSTRETYRTCPSRAVLTNGEWFIVFCRPENALMGMPSPDGEIIVFRDLHEVEARINELYPHFSYAALSEQIPEQHPAALPQFVEQGDEVQVALVNEVHVNDLGKIQPIMAVQIFARVRTAARAWITFRKDYDPKLEILPGKESGVLERRTVLQAHADALLGELAAHATITLLSPTDIERIDEEDGARHVWPSTPLCKVINGKLYSLYLGDSPLHINDDSAYDACPFHSHENCNRTGDAIRELPIIQQSMDPPAYFASGSIFHCAHKAVHVAREGRCVIAPFEQHICCRRCAFLERCWGDEAEKLPCARGQ